METFSALLAICAGNSPVHGESPHKGQLRGALMFSLICVWINDWINNREAGDLRHHRAHCDDIVMFRTQLLKHYSDTCTHTHTHTQTHPYIPTKILYTSPRYCDVLWRLKSPATRLYVLQLVLTPGPQQWKHQRSTLLGICDENPPLTSGFHSQSVSNDESASIS